MTGLFRKWLRSGPEGAPAPREAHEASIPVGERAFAIGDIHGRLDLLDALIAAIEAEDARRAPAKTTIILLGDLIDRGPHSAGVLARAREWQGHRTARGSALHILMGNHEEMLLESLDRVEVLKQFVTYGGKETILSFGISEEAYSHATWDEVQAMLRAAITPDWHRFIRGFEPIVRLGDYAFVHAGVKPERPLEEQAHPDMRWIREPFLSSTADHGAVIVHGHTIADEPTLRHNRIGLDTGAYQSGRLTALLLEGTQRWLITAQERDGAITTSLHAA